MIQVDLGSNALNGANTETAILANTEDAYYFVATPLASTYDAWLAAEIEALPLSICNFPMTPLADGDGTLTVRIFYAVIDGAP